ncbi:hypothetical protein Btru_054171 [Bulinus truncatus]|nr:hypothetical protein Btru_054171 [Bulinus truncatus]
MAGAASTFGFNNLRETWHTSDSELIKYTMDSTSGKVVSNLCEGRIASKLMFRIEPPTDVMEVFDREENDNLDNIAKSCLVDNETSPAVCDICSSEYCQWDISIPCRFKPHHSRWSAALELYVDIEDGQMTQCLVICLDIGYNGSNLTKGNSLTLLRNIIALIGGVHILKLMVGDT